MNENIENRLVQLSWFGQLGRHHNVDMVSGKDSELDDVPVDRPAVYRAGPWHRKYRQMLRVPTIQRAAVLPGCPKQLSDSSELLESSWKLQHRS